MSLGPTQSASVASALFPPFWVTHSLPITGPAPNPFIEATANSRPRYGSCSFLPPRGLLSAAPHVER